jgi:hypothetical protein
MPIVIALISVASSCQKFVAVPPPVDQLVSSTVFSDDATADAAVAGIYSSMMGSFGFNFASGALTAYPALSADEMIYANAQFDEFHNNNITIGNTQVLAMWDNAYNYIYQANIAVQQLTLSQSVTEATRTRLLGETKFIIGFCYFYLVNLYGEVPLITSTDISTTSVQPRSSVQATYQLIDQNLKDATTLLPISYLKGEKTRPNRWAAYALLARSYLYEMNWQDAEQAASLVIDSGSYSLVNLDKVFLKNSDEAIWQMYPVAYGITWDAYYFIPSSGIPNYQLTQDFLDSLEMGDQRRSIWTGSVTIQGTDYTFPAKYKSTNFYSNTEYYMVLRLSEQYLIRAEARAQQGDIAGALSDLNIIRHRAGLPDKSTIDQPSTLSAIQSERRIELFAEWGHRWLDLKRTNNADAILGSKKQGWKPNAVLYPIPQMEIQNNPALTQNIGY